MLCIHIPEYSKYSIGYWRIHISIYNIDIHVTSRHIFSGKYGHTCTTTPVMHYVPGVNDTGDAFLTGVVDAGDVMHHRCR
jgi:hypothetical protein